MNRRKFLGILSAATLALTHGIPTQAWRAAVPAGSDDTSMLTDTVYCANCDAGSLPSGSRLGENHKATRFGQDDRKFDVLEGELKNLRCYEVLAGPGGWIVESPPKYEDGKELRCTNCGCPSVLLRRLRYTNASIVRFGG